MNTALVALATAALAAALLTPVVRLFALRSGVVVVPGGRHVHQAPIPRLGGVAVLVAFFIALGAATLFDPDLQARLLARPLALVGLLVGGLTMGALGALDDIRGVGAWRKLLVQVGTAVFAFACGFRIDSIALPWLGQLEMGIFALPITIAWIVGIINALNLIDGLDGLAAGLAFFTCATNFVVGALNQDLLVVALSAALGGAILGFLLYNFNPASIFMGDSGSMFLGFSLATSSMLGASVKSATTVALLVPILAMGVPIIDTLFAMLRRVIERRPVFSPDRGHIHHRLLELGITHRRAVLMLYGFSMLLAGSAIVVATGRDWQVGASLILMSVLVIAVVRFVGYSDYLKFRRNLRRRLESESLQQLRQATHELLKSLYADPEGTRSMQSFVKRLGSFGETAGLLSISLSVRNQRGGTGVCFDWKAPEPSADMAARRQETALTEHTVGLTRGDSIRELSIAWKPDNTRITVAVESLLELVLTAYAEVQEQQQIAHFRRTSQTAIRFS